MVGLLASDQLIIISHAGHEYRTTIKLDCLESGEWQEKDFYHCVPRETFSSGEITGFIIGAISIGILLICAIAFFKKR